MVTDPAKDQLSAPTLRPRRSFQISRPPFSPKNSIMNKMTLARKASADLLRSPLRLSDDSSAATTASDDSSNKSGKDKNGKRLVPPSPEKPAANISAPQKGLRRIASSLSLALSGSTGRNKTKANNSQSQDKHPEASSSQGCIKAGFDLSDWNNDLAMISSSPASTPTEQPLVLRVPTLAAAAGDEPLHTPTESHFPPPLTQFLRHQENDSRRRKSDEMDDEKRDSFDSAMPVHRESVPKSAYPFRHASLAHAHSLRSSRTLTVNVPDPNRFYENAQSQLSPTVSSLPPPSKKISLETLPSPASDVIFGSPVSRRSRTKSGSRNSVIGPSASSSNHTLSSIASQLDWQTDVSSKRGSGCGSGNWSPVLSPGLQRSTKGSLTPSGLGTLPEGGGIDYFSVPLRRSLRDKDPLAIDAAHLFKRDIENMGDHRRDSAPCFPTRPDELDQIDLLGASQARSTSAMDVYAPFDTSDPFVRRPLSFDSISDGHKGNHSVLRGPQPLTSINSASPHPRKRSANGSLLNSSTRRSSQGSTNAAVNAWQARSRGDEMDEDEDDEDASSRSISRDGSGLFGDGRLSPPPPALTECTTSASSSLSTSLSSHAGPAAVPGGSGDYWTPQNYKNAKPLAAAFMSTGLITKRTRAQNELNQSTSSNGSRPGGPVANPAVGLPASTSRPSIMPDTPVKKAAFAHPSTNPSPFVAPLKSAASPAMASTDDSPASASTSSGEKTAHGMSPCERDEQQASGQMSPTVEALRSNVPTSSTRSASSTWKRQHLYKRRSSEIMLDSPFVAAGGAATDGHRIGTGSSSGGSLTEAEPMTPTRGGVRNEALQLVTTPGDSPGTPASVAFPSLLAQARAFSPPLAAPAGPRPSFPFTDLERRQMAPGARPQPVMFSRPQYRARHSGSTLHSLRKHELQMPSWFETNYEVRKTLGNGAFSDAYEVVDLERGGVYAVKRTKQPFNGVKDRLRRLEEVDILRLVSTEQCPQVISFVDAWEQNGHLFIQTELCENGNLCAFLEEYGREHEQLDETRVWKVLTEVAAGLQHLHDNDVLHLDIKPANIFITDLGHLQIGDFGLATRWPRPDALTIMRGAAVSQPGFSGDEEMVWRKEGERRTRAKSHNDVSEDIEREGDREYIAPEILSGRYGKPADMFSLGLLVLEAACNVVLPDNGPPWHKLRSNDFGDVDFGRLSAELVQLIRGMLERDFDERLTIGQVRSSSIVARLSDMLFQSLELERHDETAQLPRPMLGAILPEQDGWLFEIFAQQYAGTASEGLAHQAQGGEPTSMDVD